jgi:hypothetical protein
MKSPELFGTYVKLVAESHISMVIMGEHENGDGMIHQQYMFFTQRRAKKRRLESPIGGPLNSFLGQVE